MNSGPTFPFQVRDPICVSHYPVPISAGNSALLDLDKQPSHEKEIAIYVHVPFCEAICGFCPFNKAVFKEEAVKRYWEALRKEIAFYADTPYSENVCVRSINLGGGTPTALSLELLQSILFTIRTKFKVARDVMVFVEGNPRNFTIEKLKGLQCYGLNRVSVGVQTYQQASADRLGLFHSVEDSKVFTHSARMVNISNVGIDLMYNTPGQTLDEWQKDIQEAVEQCLDHICLIAFCVVPGTPVAEKIDAGKLPCIGGTEQEISYYRVARRQLLDAGYIQYSVIDFALPGKADLHAQLYFQQQCDLIGMGPAAFGYVNGYMYVNEGDLDRYEAMVNKGIFPLSCGEKAAGEEAARGAMAKGLRMLRVSRKAFADRFGEDPYRTFQSTVDMLIEKGLLELDEKEIRLTEQGIIWGNNVSKEFFSEKYRQCGLSERMRLAKGHAPEGRICNE